MWCNSKQPESTNAARQRHPQHAEKKFKNDVAQLRTSGDNPGAPKNADFSYSIDIQERQKNMIVMKTSREDRALAVLQAVVGICERRYIPPMLASVSNGFPEQGGGGASALDHAPASGLTTAEAEASGCSDGEGAPEVAASDDDDGDGDGDPDSDRRSRPRSKTSHPSFPPALLAFEPLSHYVSFGRSRIYQLIAADEFPKPIKVGKSSRWLKADIDAWIRKQTTSQRVEA